MLQNVKRSEVFISIHPTLISIIFVNLTTICRYLKLQISSTKTTFFNYYIIML